MPSRLALSLALLATVRRALEQIDAVRRETARHPADLELATTADEILAAHKRGHIAIPMGAPLRRLPYCTHHAQRIWKLAIIKAGN